MQCRVVVVDEEVAFQTFVSGAYQSDSRDTADSFLGDRKMSFFCLYPSVKVVSWSERSRMLLPPRASSGTPVRFRDWR